MNKSKQKPKTKPSKMNLTKKKKSDNTKKESEQMIKINKMIDELIGLSFFHSYLKKEKKSKKTVSTTTMVPLAMLFGKKAFQQKMNSMKKPKLQNLEDLIKTTYKIQDSNLFGVYLGLFGLTKTKIVIDKIIPLGILYSLYELMKFNDTPNNFKMKIQSVIGCENLSCYQKFLCINEVSSSTLFPIAFLYGKDKFHSTIITDIKTTNSIFNKSNDLIPKQKTKSPFLKESMLQVYLSILDLKTSDLRYNTLIPIGLLLSIYDLYCLD